MMIHSRVQRLIQIGRDCQVRFVFLLIALFVAHSPVSAEERVSFLFYYPGGEGKEEDAGPIMEMFAARLTHMSAVNVRASYYPHKVSPEILLRGKHEALILMRLDSYLDWVLAAYPIEAALLAQPLYTDTDLERYRVYGGKGGKGGKQGVPACDTVFLSLDLSKRYMIELFGRGWQNIPIAKSEEPLAKLEEIAKQSTLGLNKSRDCMLLDARQWTALQAIPFLWKESLVVIEESVPVFPPLVFASHRENPATRKVIAALRELGQSEEGQGILRELELRAFVPVSEAQKQRINEWKAKYELGHGK